MGYGRCTAVGSCSWAFWWSRCGGRATSSASPHPRYNPHPTSTLPGYADTSVGSNGAASVCRDTPAADVLFLCLCVSVSVSCVCASVCAPQVLTRKCPETGKEQEPVEEVTIDVDPQYSGVCGTSASPLLHPFTHTLETRPSPATSPEYGDATFTSPCSAFLPLLSVSPVEKMSGRKGVLLEFKDHRDKSRLVFRIPSRGMVRSPLNLPPIITNSFAPSFCPYTPLLSS